MMKTIFHTSHGLFSLLICIILCSCNSRDTPDSQTETPSAPQQVKAEPALPGHAIYTLRCEPCHGSDGTAGVLGAANLKTITADSVTMLLRVTHGQGSMPPFEKTLSSEEIQQVVQYTRTLHK